MTAPVVGPAPEGMLLPIRVTCRMTRNRSIAPFRHHVVIRPDWTVDLPHDLMSERIGVALGGHSSCVGLVDTAVPALRSWIPPMLRMTRSDVWRPADRGPWRVGTQAACCWRRPFGTVSEAAVHARSVPHVAALFGADLDLLLTMVAASRRAYGARMELAVRSHDLWSAVECCEGGYRDVVYLWGAGLPPSRIVAAHRHNGVPGPQARELFVSVLAAPPGAEGTTVAGEGEE